MSTHEIRAGVGTKSPMATRRPADEVTSHPRGHPLPAVVISVVASLVALMVAPALSSAAPSVRPAGSDAARAQLQRLLDNVVSAGAPGVVALINDGGPRHGDRDWQIRTHSSGVADLRTGRPIRSEHRFRVASVTKPFVATVMLQLVAEGRLSLEDTIERWLPGILPYGGQITIRQLLNHTSGVPDYVYAPIAELYDGNRLRSWRPQELVALVADQPPDFPAGTAWSYSNTGYVLAGLIIQHATGQRLGRELERRIFTPLGLRDTSFPTQFPFLVGPHARGYSLYLDDELYPIEGELFDITDYNPSLAWAAGNLVSDVDDLARFFRALLGGRLLPDELLAEMKTPIEIEPGFFGYGLGLEVSTGPCGPLFGHSGGIPGFSNIVLNSEDGRHQVAVMFNANVSAEAVWEPIGQVLDHALGEAFAGEPCSAVAVAARDGVPHGSRPPAWQEADLGRTDGPSGPRHR